MTVENINNTFMPNVYFKEGTDATSLHKMLARLLKCKCLFIPVKISAPASSITTHTLLVAAFYGELLYQLVKAQTRLK